MIRWISTDVATSSGAVIWEDTTPRWLVRVWPNAKKTVWCLRVWPTVADGDDVTLRSPITRKFTDDQSAWEAVWSLTYGGFQHFAAESVYGDQADTLAERRGTILVWLDCRKRSVFQWRARSSEWRAAVTYGTEERWPPGRKAKKDFSVLIVERALKAKLPDDVTDAYLIGIWFLRKEEYDARDRSRKTQRVRKAGRPKPRCRVVRARHRIVR